jgi:Domain of unknown function (DUF4384)
MMASPSQRFIRAAARGLALVSVMALALAVPARAQSRGEVVREVLENYATPLRRSGLAGTDDATRLARTVVTDLDWVQPGNADASLLYNVLVAAPSPPLPRELEAVRDWIEALPEARVQRCVPHAGEPKVLSHDTVLDTVANDLAAQPADARSKLRYLSLVALANRCAVKPEYADAAIQAVLARIAPTAASAAVLRLKGQVPLWRVNLADLKLSAASWEALAQADRTAVLPLGRAAAEVTKATGSPRAIIRGDALAAAVAAGNAPGLAPAPAARAPLHGLLQQLADAYAGPLDADAAAAELGITAAALRHALFTLRSGRERQILNRPVSRERFLGWYPRMAALLLGAPVSSPVDPRPMALTGRLEDAGPVPALNLVAERTAMATGDLVTVSVMSDRACDLEVVDVDPSGNATLLFPNDFQRDGRLRANTRLDLPGAAAAFQFRLDRVGTETIVAHCYVPGSRRIRSEHEFVRQRFLDLGSWRDTRAHTPLPLRGAEPRKPPKDPIRSTSSRLLSRAALRFTVK